MDAAGTYAAPPVHSPRPRSSHAPPSGIAWSRAGTIASISPDRCSVLLQVLRVNPDKGAWELGEPVACGLLTATKSNPIVHLAWGGGTSTLYDLAIVDAAGRVAVAQFSSCLNHGILVRKWDAEPVDDLHAIAGCYWLPALSMSPRPYMVICGPAVRAPGDSGMYQYITSFAPLGVTFPSMVRSGLVTVTSTGLLRLMWNGGRLLQPETVMVELGGTYGNDDIVTHASVVSLDKRKWSNNKNYNKINKI